MFVVCCLGFSCVWLYCCLICGRYYATVVWFVSWLFTLLFFYVLGLLVCFDLAYVGVAYLQFWLFVSCLLLLYCSFISVSVLEFVRLVLFEFVEVGFSVAVGCFGFRFTFIGLRCAIC